MALDSRRAPRPGESLTAKELRDELKRQDREERRVDGPDRHKT
jgi:hypothetical protein